MHELLLYFIIKADTVGKVKELICDMPKSVQGYTENNCTHLLITMTDAGPFLDFIFFLFLVDDDSSHQ